MYTKVLNRFEVGIYIVLLVRELIFRHTETLAHFKSTQFLRYYLQKIKNLGCYAISKCKNVCKEFIIVCSLILLSNTTLLSIRNAKLSKHRL